MIEELDEDNSGDIDLKEFLAGSSLFRCIFSVLSLTSVAVFRLPAAMQTKTADPEGEEIIMEAFKTFDTDASGALSHAEMRDVLTHLGAASSLVGGCVCGGVAGMAAASTP